VEYTPLLRIIFANSTERQRSYIGGWGFAAAAIYDKGGPNLGELLGAFILSLTVVAVVALGIISGFGAVLLILQAFAPHQAAEGTKPSLVGNQAQAAHAGGN
jgi:hypothetical protein